MHFTGYTLTAFESCFTLVPNRGQLRLACSFPCFGSVEGCILRIPSAVVCLIIFTLQELSFAFLCGFSFGFCYRLTVWAIAPAIWYKGLTHRAGLHGRHSFHLLAVQCGGGGRARTCTGFHLDELAIRSATHYGTPPCTKKEPSLLCSVLHNNIISLYSVPFNAIIYMGIHRGCGTKGQAGQHFCKSVKIE